MILNGLSNWLLFALRSKRSGLGKPSCLSTNSTFICCLTRRSRNQTGMGMMPSGPHTANGTARASDRWSAGLLGSGIDLRDAAEDLLRRGNDFLSVREEGPNLRLPEVRRAIPEPTS